MSVLEVKPRFLYPHSRQFPFDEVAENIVKALEKRNWNVYGITVKFSKYGSGEAKYKMVDEIRGENFKLRFNRRQGVLNLKWDDFAAVKEICIPKQSIIVYHDESGPRYYMYVGENWEQDKEWFMDEVKINAKFRKEPRRCLVYYGNISYGRAERLICSSDSYLEYLPTEDEPKAINLEEKFEEFTLWMKENILKYILSFPEQNIIEEKQEELIPYNGPWPLVFSLCNGKTAQRILKGKNNPKYLLKEDRHAFFGPGKRLLPLDLGREKKFPKVVYNGFIWADVNQKLTPKSNFMHILEWIVYDMDGLLENLIAIRLKYANDVYVIDYYKYTEIVYQTDFPTRRQVQEGLIARASTIVPINEYKGGYTTPVVLIARELDFDEIEWMSYSYKSDLPNIKLN